MAFFAVAVAVMACGRSALDADEPMPDGDTPGDSGAEDVTIDRIEDGGLDQVLDGSSDGIALVCGPTTCADGCCTADGTCSQVGDGHCGLFGEACEKCDVDGGYLCKSGVCFRFKGGCENCTTGCCWGQYCATGIHDNACGANGAHCALCLPKNGESCAPLPDGGGTCESVAPCSPTTCKGCCAGDICAVGTQNFACGRSGEKCADCVFQGMQCAGGQCTK